MSGLAERLSGFVYFICVNVVCVRFSPNYDGEFSFPSSERRKDPSGRAPRAESNEKLVSFLLVLRKNVIFS